MRPELPPNEEDLIPYSAKDLKYLWTLWDETQRHRQPGLRYRNIYVGAVGVILTGWLMHRPVIFRPGGHPDARRLFHRRLVLPEIPSSP